MLFTYTARAANGTLEQNQVEAESENALAEQLRKKGLLLTHAKVLANPRAMLTNGKFNLHWWSRVNMADKIFLTQNLQVMVRAGVSLSVALKTQANQTSNYALATALVSISSRVDKGVPLSDALSDHPKIFSELYINMVRAGEKSGKLDEVLNQLTTQLRKSHALTGKIRSALTYPVVVLAGMGGIGLIMIIFVIPKITSMFADFNATLPIPTRILIAVSNAAANNGLLVIGSIIVIAMAFYKFTRRGLGQSLWHKLLLTMPIIKKISRKINLARFARTFSSLLKTDIPIVQAFQITSSTLSNVEYRTALLNASERIKKGVSVATILEQYPSLFPALIIQMISVGEDTGSLDTILDELSNFYEEDVDRIMSTLATTLEPVLILLLGLGVGAMAIAIILPIYSLTQNI